MEKKDAFKNMVKLDGFKTLEIIYIHTPPECYNQTEKFEPVETASIKFKDSWLRFRLADSKSEVYIPTQNIVEVWMYDFYQRKTPRNNSTK